MVCRNELHTFGHFSDSEETLVAVLRNILCWLKMVVDVENMFM
jgi:hypothetical protein